MKTLAAVVPTPEQLPIISNAKPGVSLIRGAAGSGKTTTAILRLRQLTGFWLSRRRRQNVSDPVRVLVVTFNRTLRGYIAELAEQQVARQDALRLKVTTFGKWAQSLRPDLVMLDDSECATKLRQLGSTIPLTSDFLQREVDYVLGRFPPSRLGDYLTCNRVGRGSVPRVPQAVRQQVLDDVIAPYNAWKKSLSRPDWNDLAGAVVSLPPAITYDIIIADEAQDLSANQVRALMHCAANPSSVTFVLDAAQRIYPRGFTWKEAGVAIQESYRLSKNYRNTVEICRFAQPLLKDLEMGDDGTFPDFNTCLTRGPVPVVLKGKYSDQLRRRFKITPQYQPWGLMFRISSSVA